MRNRIDYGIDLGTTNSAIARMENGESVIKKSEFQKDTTASAIAFRSKGRMQVGDSAFIQLKSDRLKALTHFTPINNVFIEVKRTMGTDEKYVSDVSPEIVSTSEDLSSEILKKLKSYISDETVHAAVITIPAEFSVKQQQATQRAGELAGFSNCQLLQEPVAAAMAYAAEGELKNGKFLVFDFGGGTFDSALVVVQDGVLNVTDSEGDNFLGGKDLDYAIVDELILPYLKEEYSIDSYLNDPLKKGLIRDAMKAFAEEAKIQLSFKEQHEVMSDLGEIPLEDEDGNELELDLTLNRGQLKEVLTPIFQRAVDKAIKLLERSGLKGSDLDELVLVGGPTMSPILRDLLADQIKSPNTSVDPMTAVARGAALFASTIEVGETVEVEQKKEVEATGETLLQLDAKYESTSVLDEEVVVLKPKPGMEGQIAGCKVELKRTGWTSGQVGLTPTGVLLDVLLEEGKPNVFEVFVINAEGNRIKSQPETITILQGTKVGGAPLPNSLGIEVWNEKRQKRVFAALRGADKGRPLPVTGVINGLSTKSELRPGDTSTILRISVYEGGEDAVGKSTAFCETVAEYSLSGAEIERTIPVGSEFDLTLETEPTSSVPVSIQLSFNMLDMDFELDKPDSVGSDLGEDWFDRQVRDGEEMLEELVSDGQLDSSTTAEMRSKLEETSKLMGNATDRGGRDQAVHRLREVLRELEGLGMEQDWPKAEAEMDRWLSDLIQKNAESGNEQTTMLVKDFERKVQQVKGRKDASAAAMLIEQMEQAYFNLTPREEMLKGFIAYTFTEFDSITWKDRGRARAAVDTAAQLLMQEQPTLDALQRNASAVNDLIDRSKSSGGGVNIPSI